MKITTSVIIKNAVLLLNFLPNFFAVRLSLRSQYKVQSSGVNEAVKEIIKIICREKKFMTLCLKITQKSLIFRNSAVSLYSSAFFALGQKVLPDFFRSSQKNCKIHQIHFSENETFSVVFKYHEIRENINKKN